MKERFESSPGPAAGEITATAFAKINLYLHVVGKRPDGYHLLDSLVVFAGIGDRITATAADGLALVIDGPFVDSLDKCRIGDNLVFRAAHRLAEEGGVRADASIRLEKNLPVAAGLGGGSADAAAALRALVTLWRLSAPAEDLARIALELGADVPVCLGGRAAFVSGIGERLAPAPKLPDAFAVLANPRRNLKTAGIFGDLRREEWSPASPFDAPPANESVRVSARHRLISIRPDDGFDVRIGQVTARGGIMR